MLVPIYMYMYCLYLHSQICKCRPLGILAAARILMLMMTCKTVPRPRFMLKNFVELRGAHECAPRYYVAVEVLQGRGILAATCNKTTIGVRTLMR